MSNEQFLDEIPEEFPTFPPLKETVFIEEYDEKKNYIFMYSQIDWTNQSPHLIPSKENIDQFDISPTLRKEALEYCDKIKQKLDIIKPKIMTLPVAMVDGVVMTAKSRVLPMGKLEVFDDISYLFEVLIFKTKEGIGFKVRQGVLEE